MDAWGVLLALAVLFILTVFPLYIIVKLLGGKVSLMKALVIKVAAVVITLLLSMAFGLVGPLLVAVCLIILYMAAFRMGVIRASIAWLLEGVVLVVLILAFGALGITALKWSSIVGAVNYLAGLI